jgi:hypothetical protein
MVPNIRRNCCQCNQFLQLKIVGIVVNVYFLLQMTNFLLMKCHKANVCTPMHRGPSKNTKCVIGNLKILKYLTVTNFEKLFFFHNFDFYSILVKKKTFKFNISWGIFFWMWTCYKIKWTQHMTIVLQGVCTNLNNIYHS